MTEPRILTNIDEDEPVDDGVETVITADEEYVVDGEEVHRKTDVRVLEDGGVHITQSYERQDMIDSLTLGSDVVNRLVCEVDR